ncbi:MAG TPA: LuxR C-terminal-related transcriptional regulator, partial [Capillimicrobium sp.]
GARYEAQRARLLLGHALSAGGDRAGAVEALRAAERELGAMGAEGLRAEAARELRGLGVRVQRATSRRGDGEGEDGALAGLSARELEVAELIAEGRTNREIADALIVTPKTVETHVRNIFGKLGAGSRVDVAAIVTRARG